MRTLLDAMLQGRKHPIVPRPELPAAFLLKPASIVTAAEADLELRQHQRSRVGEEPRSQPYCFHRRHVARASCALELIDLAIRDRYTGVYGGKRITRIIYGDADLLWAARQLLSPVGGAAS
jgi:hypothetical protein